MQRPLWRERERTRGLEAVDARVVRVRGEEAVAAAEARGVTHLRVPPLEQERGELARQAAAEPAAAQAGLVVRSLTKATKNYGVIVQGAPMNTFGGRTVFGLVADPAANEGVSHYGTVLTGSAVASFQASGVGLGIVGTWSWAGYKSTPVLDGAANSGGTLVGFWAQDAIPGVGAPSLAASVGFSVDNISGLSVFGLISQITAGATRWALYLIGGAKSFIGGKSFFGGTTATDPTATVHIVAGSTAANSAPIKLTSGSLMTTPENGAIEYDGTHLYITIGGVRKQLD